MKKQLLLIVMTLCAVSAMAVSLPTSSYHVYQSDVPSNQGYTLSVGTTFVNHSTVGTYGDICVSDELWTGDASVCKTCCEAEMDKCMSETNNNYPYCKGLNADCHENCDYKALNEPDSPLDAPTAFLLALIAAYGALAVYRKKVA